MAPLAAGDDRGAQPALAELRLQLAVGAERAARERPAAPPSVSRLAAAGTTSTPTSLHRLAEAQASAARRRGR